MTRSVARIMVLGLTALLVLPTTAQAHESTLLPGHAYSTVSDYKPGCHFYSHEGYDFIEVETRRGQAPCRVTYRVRIPDGFQFAGSAVGVQTVMGHGALIYSDIVGPNTVRVVVRWTGRPDEFSEATVDWVEVVWRAP